MSWTWLKLLVHTQVNIHSYCMQMVCNLCMCVLFWHEEEKIKKALYSLHCARARFACRLTESCAEHTNDKHTHMAPLSEKMYK